MRSVMDPVGIAVVGCGNIGMQYLESLHGQPLVNILGMTDPLPERAAHAAKAYGCRVYQSLTEILEDPQVDIVVNLTPAAVHPEIIRQCVGAGKHVYSEKPLAFQFDEANELVKLAEKQQVILAVSPFLHLGTAQQEMKQMIRDGAIGSVRVVYAEANHGRIESWHPNPEAFYDVGPLIDVGVYPITLLTDWFGAVHRVWAYGSQIAPVRVRKDGISFRGTAWDFVVVILEFAEGVIARLTVNFYVGSRTKQGEMVECHGDRGSLYLSYWLLPDAKIEAADFEEPYQTIAHRGEPVPSFEWDSGVMELTEAIVMGRPCRMSAGQAAHVVDVINATERAVTQGTGVAVDSRF